MKKTSFHNLIAGRLVGALSLCALLALALVACPGERNQTAVKSPSKVADAGSKAEPDKAKPEQEPASAAGITGEEPPPGSLKVEDVGPAAPTLYFLAGLKGYTEPCGCTLDILLGGLDRIGGYLGDARKLAKGSVLVDAGNMLFDMPKLESHRVAQERAKADVIVQAQLELGLASTTPGPNDFALGKIFYLDKVRGAGIEILVANLEESEGLALGVPHAVHDLEGTKVGVIGLVQPDLFLGIEGLKVSDPIEAARRSVAALKKEGVTTIVAVYHGDLKAVKLLLETMPEISFAVVGHKPRESGQVDAAGEGYTLEAYDQGRHLGVLKLYPNGQADPETWENARKVSKADLERIDRRIEQVSQQIERMPPATPGKEPVFLKRLRDQLKELEAEKQALSNAKIELPKDKAAFIYRAVPMMPGYPLNANLTAAREAFNDSLKSLVPDEPIIPAEPGKAEYVGSEKCASCHPQPTAVWKKTAHSHAINTLIERSKDFDGNCIGCHVTGYREPGGSVLGKLQYPTRVGEEAFTKKLENVGCEVCHGPGSLHMQAPVDKDAKPQHITLQVPEKVCGKCHNSEHSPRFNYDVYIEQVLGEGHAREKSAP